MWWLCYVAVRRLGYVEGGPGPAGFVVWVGVEMPEAPPGGLRRVGGARGSGAVVVVTWLIAAACYAEPGVPRHEVRLCCRCAQVG